MSLLQKFKYKTATPPDLKKYIGRKVEIDGQPVLIEAIVGNVWKPAFYEINGEHLMGMLRFHAQMLGDKSITEQQFKAFEEIDYHVEKVNQLETPKKDIWNGTSSKSFELDADALSRGDGIIIKDIE